MRTIFVGDVHGCATELLDILKKTNYAADRDRLLLTGDAFARGPDPLGVWHLICEHNAEMVLGNHDARLLLQLDDPSKASADQRYTLRRLEPVHSELHTWLKERPLYIKDDFFVLVHAGINPQRGLEGTCYEEFITIRTWPPIKGIAGPRWHDHYEKQYALLVFGHDAPGGLIVKKCDGRPYVLGLDTGCVYGRQLSAYVLEEQRLVQVPSRQETAAWEQRDG
jgi:bis(5'-nucleosyl)-tetraphosphatase (symmetrical)